MISHISGVMVRSTLQIHECVGGGTKSKITKLYSTASESRISYTISRWSCSIRNLADLVTHATSHRFPQPGSPEYLSPVYMHMSPCSWYDVSMQPHALMLTQAPQRHDRRANTALMPGRRQSSRPLQGPNTCPSVASHTRHRALPLRLPIRLTTSCSCPSM